MRFLGSLFAGLIVGIVVFTFSTFVMGIAGVLQLLPRLVPLAAKAVWGVLMVSCRLYYLLLSRLAAPIQSRTRLDILTGLWRLLCTVGLSLAIGTGVLLLLGWTVSMWTGIVCVLHGLFVDFMWSEIPDSGQLYMGTRIQ